MQSVYVADDLDVIDHRQPLNYAGERIAGSGGSWGYRCFRKLWTS